jgi:hypothetical protein
VKGLLLTGTTCMKANRRSSLPGIIHTAGQLRGAST